LWSRVVGVGIVVGEVVEEGFRLINGQLAVIAVVLSKGWEAIRHQSPCEGVCVALSAGRDKKPCVRGGRKPPLPSPGVDSGDDFEGYLRENTGDFLVWRWALIKQGAKLVL
jgi:hypothetical protein